MISLVSGIVVLLAAAAGGAAQTVPFADNGALKMLYDNRMYPQAVSHAGRVYLAWRGERGLPYIRAYDLQTRAFSHPVMLLSGLNLEIDAARFQRDHHFAPVIWTDPAGRLHALFGCHGTPGYHLVSKAPAAVGEWERAPGIAESMSYPKVHRILGNRTLIYFRDRGHLGSWTYRISADGHQGWMRPGQPVVDMDAEPRDGFMADHAGSYHTTKVSADGRVLHVAFIWKMEKPVLNTRYHAMLHDHTQRYNLYYLKVDLESGKAFNISGKELRTPVNKGAADRDCLVWDTEERVAAVGPSIYLDENGAPHFLLPVSEETPHRCRFYFVRRQGDRWARTAITETPHPFNASHLDRTADGNFRAFLIAGEGEALSDKDEQHMDGYGWGSRVEQWISNPGGDRWRRAKDLTPTPGLRYQNIQFVSEDLKEIAAGMLLFYGWREGSDKGTAFLWDSRGADKHEP